MVYDEYSNSLKKGENMKILNWITLLLVIIGGLNWGLIGLFEFNLVAALFGLSVIAKLIYILVGLSAVWTIIRIPKLLR